MLVLLDFGVDSFSLRTEVCSWSDTLPPRVVQPASSSNETIVRERRPHNDRQAVIFTAAGAIWSLWHADKDLTVMGADAALCVCVSVCPQNSWTSLSHCMSLHLCTEPLHWWVVAFILSRSQTKTDLLYDSYICMVYTFPRQILLPSVRFSCGEVNAAQQTLGAFSLGLTEFCFPSWRFIRGL